ncbi:RabGAP/TBC domain-containing protein [Reticulomyxa filosa]|uniref:RabGAP/TBC domain-containing protein n=1 Tax=Reticulomyxa filosa TaxID=46433 RepID=X6N5K4_RETFI|nr:RabGAP/TBC domain-containing protein [Reticulomyxa filosa]|eukprot:ETO21024.1 RabGAP/TBC domain-containing protein [Reticulomyxa filosa]
MFDTKHSFDRDDRAAIAEKKGTRKHGDEDDDYDTNADADINEDTIANANANADVNGNMKNANEIAIEIEKETTRKKDTIKKEREKEAEVWYEENLRAPIRHRHQRDSDGDGDDPSKRYDSVHYRTSKFQDRLGYMDNSHPKEAITTAIAAAITGTTPTTTAVMAATTTTTTANVIHNGFKRNGSGETHNREDHNSNSRNDEHLVSEQVLLKSNVADVVDHLQNPPQELKEGLEWNSLRGTSERRKKKFKKYTKSMALHFFFAAIGCGLTSLFGWRLYYYYYKKDKVLKTKTNNLWKTLMANKSTKSLLRRAECHTS